MRIASLLLGWFIFIMVAPLVLLCPSQVLVGLRVDLSAANVARIQPGMPRSQAEQILGAPPGHYVLERDSGTGPVCDFAMLQGKCWWNWETYRGYVTVVTDPTTDLVVAVHRGTNHLGPVFHSPGSAGAWLLGGVLYVEFCVFVLVPVRLAFRRLSNDAPTPRWCKWLQRLWLVVTASIVLYFVVPFQVCRGWFMDTSQVTAQKIQPGMPLEEVEHIVGGPPGNYSLTRTPGKFHKGKAIPNEFRWTTSQGTIVVVDGVYLYGFDGPMWMPPPDGLVDSVRWEALPQEHTLVDVVAIVGISVAGVVTLFWWVFVYAQEPKPRSTPI
jgi:hypothetical protein